MKRRIASAILCTLLLALAPRAATAQTNKLITPKVSVSPQIFSISQPASLLLTVSNANPGSTAKLESGDRFTFTFDAASGSGFALDSAVLVNSSTLTPADFGVIIDPAPRRLTITYTGASRFFNAGESFAVKLTFTPRAQVGAGRLTSSLTAAGSIPVTRFNEIDVTFTNLAFVDFPVGPEGEEGPQGQTGATGPQGQVGATGAPGPQGIVGLQGLIGLTGAQGAQGVQGVPGAKGLNWRGVWSDATSYVTDDAVSFNGSSWIAQRANSNAQPAEGDDWTIVAMKGDTGEQGETGAQGAQGQQGIQGVQGPVGAQGATGQQGPAGPTGDGNFIQNTTTQQTTSNFNISGDGTAGGTLSSNVVNATTQFNIGSLHILSNRGTNNLFAGDGAGQSNTSGGFNTFIGRLAGGNVTTGSGNVFIGNDTGLTNQTGISNTLLGSGANVSSGNLAFATAIGAGASVTASNTIMLGRLNGSDRVIFPGPITANSINTSGTITTGGGITSAGLISAFGGITATGLIRANGGLSASGGLTVSGHLVVGSFGTGGLITANGGINMQNNLVLNESQIRLRGGNDDNHAIEFDPDIDGIRFTAFDRFRWVRGNGNIQQMILRGDGVLSTRGGFNGKCVDLFAGNGFCNQDLAETFRTKEQTEPGDVVTLIPQDHARPTVRRSLRAYDEHLVGVISSNPGLVFDEGETRLAGANDKFITKEKAPVAAVGRVPVKFSLENGAINVGDPLTSSATQPGKAMKATGAGKIIGIALESSAKAKDGKLLLWLQVGYHAPAASALAQERKEKEQLVIEVQTLKAENASILTRLANLEKSNSNHQ